MNWRTDWLIDWRTYWLTHFSTSELQKVARTRQFFQHFDLKMRFAPQWRAIFSDRHFKNGSDRVLYILTCQCASRHSGVPFFHIETLKIAPELKCFVRLTCKCASRHSGVPFFPARNFKWLRACGALCILTWKCASRHSGVQFFISLLNSYLRTRRFGEPTFRTSGNHESLKKHSGSRRS